MKRLSIFVALVVLAISISGCALLDRITGKTGEVTTPVVTAPTITADAVFDSLRGIGCYSQNDDSDTLAKMTTGAYVSKLTKFMITATKDTVDVTFGELKDASQAAAVKAEIEALFVALKAISPDTSYSFVDVGDPMVIATVSWGKADEAIAQKAIAALGTLKK